MNPGQVKVRDRSEGVLEVAGDLVSAATRAVWKAFHRLASPELLDRSHIMLVELLENPTSGAPPDACFCCPLVRGSDACPATQEPAAWGRGG